MENNFKGLHTVEIKLIRSTKLDSIPTAHRVVDAVIKMIDSGNVTWLYYHPQSSTEKIQTMLKEHFGDSISFLDGCLDGCYGSNTGKNLSGFTCYVDAVEFPDRWSTEDEDGYSEFFNPVLTIQESGWKLIKGIDEDGIESLFEAIDPKGQIIKGDNTYNHSGNSETVSPLYDVDFEVLDIGSSLLVAAKFHHGGDVRGNYGSKYLFAVESFDDLYNGLMPSWCGKDEVKYETK